MKDNFLLKTKNAERLYCEAAKELPIIDFHNHICVSDVVSKKQFADITELWIASDPYKHRLMRICGVNEHYITGNASAYEKFEKFCEIFPFIAGNPVYDWSRMELSFFFGINELPSRDTAKRIFDRTNEMLKSPEYSAAGILARFNIEYQSPVATLVDDLSLFNGKGIAPSLRGDDLLAPTSELKDKISKMSGVKISDVSSYIKAVSVILDAFSKKGCRFADHALDAGFFAGDTDGSKSRILELLGVEYAKRGWTLLLHLGAERKTSTRLLKLAGAAGGYAAVGRGVDVSALCGLLDRMELGGGLPDTVLFPLNMSDHAALAVMQGSFSEDGVASKVQLGPAWWWCDHALGIKNALSCISSFGALSKFIGMTTDSRSLLSLLRHDYFRRILCSWLDEQNAAGEWDLPYSAQRRIIEDISYTNAKIKIYR